MAQFSLFSQVNFDAKLLSLSQTHLSSLEIQCGVHPLLSVAILSNLSQTHLCCLRITCRADLSNSKVLSLSVVPFCLDSPSPHEKNVCHPVVFRFFFYFFAVLIFTCFIHLPQKSTLQRFIFHIFHLFVCVCVPLCLRFVCLVTQFHLLNELSKSLSF